MSKYIIEIAEEYEEYFKGVLICGIADGKFAVDVIAREDLEELNSDYINEHYGSLQDEAYQQGLNDAWEAVKKIALGPEDGALNTHQLEEIFGTYFVSEIIRERTAQEVIDKIKAYEDKRSDRIEVGDEVEAPQGKAVVTAVEDDLVHYFYSGGDYGCIELYHVTKTGKHYDIQSILEAMRT